MYAEKPFSVWFILVAYLNFLRPATRVVRSCLVRFACHTVRVAWSMGGLKWASPTTSFDSGIIVFVNDSLDLRVLMVAIASRFDGACRHWYMVGNDNVLCSHVVLWSMLWCVWEASYGDVDRYAKRNVYYFACEKSLSTKNAFKVRLCNETSRYGYGRQCLCCSISGNY